MNVKCLIAGLLAGAVCLSMMTACSQSGTESASQQDSKASASQSEQSSRTDESKTEQGSKADESKTEQSTPEDPSAGRMCTLTIRDGDKHTAIIAHFFNSNSGKSEDIAMQKVEEGEGYYLYTADANVNAYNMVNLVYGGDPTDDVAFNEFVSGWSLKDDELLPYVKGQEPSYSPVYETKVFTLDGEDKNVYIWTPKDYDANAAEKYDTIYMLDGQAVLSESLQEENICWNVSESVEGMMAATDHKAILVNIEASPTDRYAEMTTDIGGKYEVDPVEGRKGNAFSTFISDTLMPYIQEHYNVYSEPAHNFLAGSSMGGLAAFRFGLDHPDKVGAVGAFSSSFWADDEETWKNYLESKDFSKSPFIYMYCGAYGEDMGGLTEQMYAALLEMGYPKDKIVFHKNETGEHHIPYWRGIYPEFLEAAFTGRVTGIESGSEVKYIDRTIPERPEVTPDENDDRSPEITNYVFFDNSQTKWERVFAYWWGGNPYNKVTGEPMYGREWPGIEMEQVEGTDIYRIAVPEGATNIIFDSGITDEEVKNGVIAYQTKDLIFDSTAHYGQIYTIDISEAPKAQKGKEKTKFKYNAGDWSRYEG